jgi:2-polyprenyl-6-hydroxyphenyl methylase / 3-demethylubiquinone-9 3-methyltransferase
MDPLSKTSVNNEFYDTLGDRWYTAHDDPVALLRAESRLRLPWVLSALSPRSEVLDLACGVGFLSNSLASAGHSVTGVDLSLESLEVAKRQDTTRAVRYLQMNALRTSFPDQSFDAVCSMDFLEHVTEPAQVIQEVSRVLRPGGLFFFHTFNRTFLSKLIVIRGVEWFVRNTPANMHISELFLKPSEVRGFCESAGLQVLKMRGVRPRIFQWAMLKLFLTGTVSKNFEFVFSRSLATGYSGIARRCRIPSSD